MIPNDEDSFLTTYQGFLDTTWQAVEERHQVTEKFPYVLPTDPVVRRAYYMKNRTLLVHNQLMWGPEAESDRPVVPTAQEGSRQKSSSGGTLILLSGGSGGGDIPSGGNDGDDPDKRKSDKPSSKGGDSQDPEKKKEEQEATTKEPEKTSAEREAQEKIDSLERQLKEAREDAERATREADDKARKLGEELAQQIDDEKAKKKRKRESSKAKRQRKKQKKAGATTEGGAPTPDDEGDSDDSEDDEEPEGEERSKGEKPEDDSKKSEAKKESEEKAKIDGEEKSHKTQEGPPKDEEPEESWTEVLKRVVKPRQNISKAADKARARTYPRARCEETAQPNYTYRAQHVPTREPVITGKWSLVEKIKDIPPNRNPIRLKDLHKAIAEHGTRKRYTDYKICVLQVLNAGKQTPPPASPFAFDGGDTYWVQTTMQSNEDGSLPFSELPGMFPSLYTFDTFWGIPRRQEGQQLKGITLGVAQYVVGTFELDFRKKAGTNKPYIENEPVWFNMEAFRAARVLLKEVSACFHQQDMGVMNWGHGFIYHPSEINLTRALQERFPNFPNSGRWVHISALVEHLYSVKHEDLNHLPFHTRGFV